MYKLKVIWDGVETYHLYPTSRQLSKARQAIIQMCKGSYYYKKKVKILN